MLEHTHLRFVTSESNLAVHTKSFCDMSKAYYESGQYSLCKFLKRGIEDWLHIKFDKGLISSDQLNKFIGGLVYESKSYEKDSDIHPWHPGHSLGSILWKNINHINKILSENDEFSLILLNILRTTKGYEGYRKLTEINFFDD